MPSSRACCRSNQLLLLYVGRKQHLTHSAVDPIVVHPKYRCIQHRVVVRIYLLSHVRTSTCGNMAAGESSTSSRYGYLRTFSAEEERGPFFNFSSSLFKTEQYHRLLLSASLDTQVSATHGGGTHSDTHHTIKTQSKTTPVSKHLLVPS